jgi:hypothetical protein
MISEIISTGGTAKNGNEGFLSDKNNLLIRVKMFSIFPFLRNIQMMWSSLNNIPSFRPALVAGMLLVPRPVGGGLADNAVPDDAVPSVIHVAELIETGWRNGFDVDGGNQLGMNLVGTKTWIGATEAFALFSSLGIK